MSTPAIKGQKMKIDSNVEDSNVHLHLIFSLKNTTIAYCARYEKIVVFKEYNMKRILAF